MIDVATTVILGIEVPDTRTAFLVTLAIHVLAGLTAVVAGAVAATARKRRGRHSWAGRVYLVALAVVAGSAAVLVGLRWPHNMHLLALGAGAAGAALLGYRACRRRRSGWARRHILGMGASYVLLLTAFYVDNGPQLPVWKLLPDWVFWLLPAAIGAPIVVRALVKYRAWPTTPGPPARRATDGQH